MEMGHWESELNYHLSLSMTKHCLGLLTDENVFRLENQINDDVLVRVASAA